MKQTIKNSGDAIKRLVRRLAVEKKKTIVSFCLIGIMVFMWVRVLGSKTPETVEATVTNLEAGQSKSELKISFIALSKVKGRNDVLARDFFTTDNWQGFTRVGEGGNLSGIEEVSVVSKDGREEVIRRVAEKLKLEAIGLGKNPRAFINDKLLSVGDKWLVKDRGDMYECEVVRIGENTVFIRCGEAEITLKLTQVIEVAD